MENSQYKIDGFLKIFDPETLEVFVDKHNAIHYENISFALANSLANAKEHFVSEMHFGRGGTSINSSGVISYLPPNVNTQSADLYNPTFYKVVDRHSIDNRDPLRNHMSVRHVAGTFYSDVLVTCLLDYGDPGGQLPFDNATTLDNNFVFDELGLKSYSPAGPGSGKLLTHVVFHPIQKSLNRLIQIDYTLRIQSLTNLTASSLSTLPNYDPYIMPNSGALGSFSIGLNQPLQLAVRGGPPNQVVTIYSTFVPAAPGDTATGFPGTVTRTLDVNGNFTETSRTYTVAGTYTYSFTFPSSTAYNFVGSNVRTYVLTVA